jgi:hypothetical protein
MVAAAAPRNPRPRPCPQLRCPAPPPSRSHRTVGRKVPAGAGKRAPGWGRLRPASGGVDHRPCSRPPWLSTTGTALGGGEGGAAPGGGGGCGCAGGGEASRCAPPRVHIALRRFLRRGHRSFIGNDGRQTIDNQKLTKGGFRRGGLNFAPLPTPPQKDTICRWDWGVAGFDLTQKGTAGDAIIMMWTMTTMTMVRGGSKGKSINDNIIA